MALYGATSEAGGVGNLYTIDSETGVATLVGSIGFGVTGLAYDVANDVMYGSTANIGANARKIITIDLDTGAGTLVGATGNTSSPVADIAFDSGGNLWGWSEQTDDLVSIDKATGAVTVVADAGISTLGDGMSFDADDVLYACLNGDDGVLRTVDVDTGLTTVVATLTGSPIGGRSIPAGAFGPDGKFYALDGLGGPSTVHLVTIDVATGVITDIGATTPFMDGLAWTSTSAGAAILPGGARRGPLRISGTRG